MFVFVRYRRQFGLEPNWPTRNFLLRAFLSPLHMTPDTPEKVKKRKRDVELPRITYTAASRTFDRLFKGNDFDSWPRYHGEFIPH